MEGDIRVWEIRSRELISHLKEHNSRVTKIKLFPDDTHLLSCARDKSILCWDLKAEKRVSAQSQRMGGLNCFAMSPLDNNKYISVGQERRITYWDLRKVNAEAVLDSSPFKGESEELNTVDELQRRFVIKLGLTESEAFLRPGGLAPLALRRDIVVLGFLTKSR